MTLEAASLVRAFAAGAATYRHVSLDAAQAAGLCDLAHAPMSIRVLFENLLRNHLAGGRVTREEVVALGHWTPDATPDIDIGYIPTRIIMPDSSGIPLLADLAAMRDAMVDLGGDPQKINPVSRVDVVVDHSVIVDFAGQPDAAARNLAIDYERNGERYAFLKWAQGAFQNMRIVPPGQGIIHQVNLEFLAEIVSVRDGLAFPDTVLGMDSHTPMVNALGTLGWGCGGIEAGAAMLGQPVSMQIPQVVGVRLTGALTPGVTATDLVLTVTQTLRRKGVVQKFVEFGGSGLDALPMAARATISNMAPEYGATIGFFAVDSETLRYLAQTGRSPEHIALVEAYAKVQGLWRDDERFIAYCDHVEIDLAAVEPSLAGPKRPQDRLSLTDTKASLRNAIPEGRSHLKTAELPDGSLALAAITSCTNTSNPYVVVAAALLARNARARGLTVKPWVKTSFSPGSRVVADYLDRAGLQPHLDALGFHVTGFGCMTCMGNSGGLKPQANAAIERDDAWLATVLSGNRNFEGRVHTSCRLNYLASPPLVVAFALAGTMNIDLTREPLGTDADGKAVTLADIWPADAEISDIIAAAITPQLYQDRYAGAFAGDTHWQELAAPEGSTFEWDARSTYIRRPPFFNEIGAAPTAPRDIIGARPLAIFGDSITTDHISPIGVIGRDGSAGAYLAKQGIAPKDFNSFGARRVNHDVMMRGTFANVRIRNEMAAPDEGGQTRHMPSGERTTIYDAAARYAATQTPLVVIAGREYGTGSSRDWAAKGTRLLGVRAVIAESFERIHRSNLVGMGIVPCQFRPGENRLTLKLDGSETFDILGLADLEPGGDLELVITRADGTTTRTRLLCRIDTDHEAHYFRHGGILPAMLRQLHEAA